MTTDTVKLDTVKPEGAWAFDETVTACFDDMLARSIPQYEVMRQAVFSFQRAVLPSTGGGRLIDLGTSRGESVALAIDALSPGAEFVLVETSKPMLDAVRDRYGALSNVRVEDRDLRLSFPDYPSDVIQAVLTLQFIPINYRQQILQRAYRALRPGGAFILVEKILGQGARLDFFEKTFYHRLKNAHGYSYEDIDRKRESLEGVLVPVTARWNEQLLREAGFSEVDGFWRWMNFAGWVALK